MKKTLLSFCAVMTMAFSYGQAYQTQNAGIPLASAGVRDFSIVDQQTNWVIFYDGSGGETYPRYVGVTANGGTNWNTRLVSALPTTALVSDIQGINASTAYIVTAPSGSNGAANGLWKTTDAGVSWSKINGVFSNASFGNIVQMWSNGTGLVIGDPVNNKYEMYKTTDGGNTWSTLTTAPTPLNGDEYGYVGGKVIFENNIWLTSNTGRILHSNDYGTTWNSYFSPIDDFAGANSSGSMAFSSATYGLIVDNNSILWVTENGGADWDIKDAVNYFDGDIKYIPGTPNSFVTTGISQTSDLGFGTAFSHDGGEIWEFLDMGDQRGTIGVYDCSTMYVGQFTQDASGTGGILKLNNPIPGCNLGVSDTTTKKIELKAVVNNGTLNVISNKEIKEVLVLDMTGKAISKADKVSVNVSQLKAGTYVARVAYTDGAFGTVKFIVK